MILNLKQSYASQSRSFSRDRHEIQRFTALAVLLMIGVFGIASLADGANMVTTADGDWSDPIWSTAEPGTSDSASIDHNVTVTQSGEIATSVGVGQSSAGQLTILSGSLGPPHSFMDVFLGLPGGTGVMNVQGGTVRAENIDIGTFMNEGTLHLSGGTVEATLGVTMGLNVSAPGRLIIEGNGSTFTTPWLSLGPSGGSSTIILRPTENGAAGLSTIQVSSTVNMNSGTDTLDFDPQYTPSVNDSWAFLVSSSGPINGSFETITTPSGVTVSVTESPANTLTLTVTAVPDVTPPTADSITPATTGPTNASSVDFTVIFSEDVVNFDSAADVVVTHSGTASSGVSISGSGDTYTATVSGITGDGSFTLAVNTGSDVEDTAGNGLNSSVTSSAVTIDNTAPALSIGSPSETDTNTGPVSYNVTYTGATSVNLTTGDITLNTTGTATATVGVTNGTTSTPTVTLSSITGDGTLGISVNSGTSSDDAGNTDAGAGPSTSFNVDNVSPGVDSIVLSGGKGAPVDFIVTFSEAVTGVDSTDFSLTTTGSITGAFVSTVSGSGTTYTVTVDSGSGTGTIRLDVTDDDTIIDAASNPLGGPGVGNGDFTAGDVFNNAVAMPAASTSGLLLLGLLVAMGAGLAVYRVLNARRHSLV